MEYETKFKWKAIDHVVITCADIDLSSLFYRDLLGMHLNMLADGRVEAQFGHCKLNLQSADKSYGPPRNAGRKWSANICMIVESGLKELEQHLKEAGVRIEDGPIERRGALGPITSIYVYDPDENLIEISEYLQRDA